MFDQVVSGEKRQLIDRRRAFAQVPRGEALRRAVRLEIEPPLEQGRMAAKRGGRRLATPLERVHAQALEGREGDPFRHALGEPLLSAALAAGELDLRDVGEL